MRSKRTFLAFLLIAFFVSVSALSGGGGNKTSSQLGIATWQENAADFGDGKDEPSPNDLKINANSLKRRNAGTAKDSYENNDEVLCAKLISPTQTGRPQDYSVSISATLSCGDQDYYRFDAFGDATASVSLFNVPSDCNYNFDILKHKKNVFAQPDDATLVETVAAGGAGVAESSSVGIDADAWYIRVFSADYTDDSKYYTLAVTVAYNVQPDCSIGELRYDKNAKGALWVSDYVPSGADPFSSYGQAISGMEAMILGVYHNWNGNPFPNEMETMANGTRVTASVAYIWDRDVRIECTRILKIIRDNKLAEYDRNEKIKTTVSKITNVIDGVASVVGLAISLFPGGGIAADVLDLVSDGLAGSDLIYDLLIGTILPDEWNTDVRTLVEYLTNLITALDADGNTSETEVVRIESSYKFGSVRYPADNGNWSVDYYNDYSYSFDELASQEFLYASDSLPSYLDGGIVYGKNYALRDSDIVNLLNQKYTLPSDMSDTNTGGDQAVSLISTGDVPSKTLNLGEYYWFHFTAPEHAYYTFYSGGYMDTYGEIFPSIVNGRSVSGRLYLNEDASSTNLNFSITAPMLKGGTYYIRVHGHDWNGTGNFSFWVTEGATIHDHVYTYRYSAYSSAQHKAFCACGTYILSPHVVASNSYFIIGTHRYGYCVDCGARVDLGTTPVIVESASILSASSVSSLEGATYVTSNGGIALSKTDMESYLSGDIDFA